MDRKGSSILTGTLLLSLLLTPPVRSRLVSSGNSGGGGSETATQVSGTGHAGSGLRAQGKWSDQKRQITEDQAAKDYEDDFDRVLNVGCPKKNPAGACLVQPQDFIIAILPDPIHTHLALQFDRGIEVIEEAAQDEGYIFDRAIMPWDTKVHPESDDHEKRLEALWYDEARQRYPGLMIFRGGSQHRGEALFVLVVTETPTGGIRRQQFTNATKEIGEVTHKDLSLPESWGWNKSNPACQGQEAQNSPACVPRGLRILGPSFSGSLASLNELLTCKASTPNGCPLVSIHSGTVSSRRSILTFEQAMQPQNVHLVSFMESDDVAVERFIEFLTGTAYGDDRNSPKSENRNYSTKNIALLSEDESAYGNFLREQTQEDTPEERCDADAEKSEQRCMLKLYFPREISQLRAAYQRDVAGVSGNNANGPPPDILRATPDVPGSDDDTVPIYSSKQMPLSQEAVMLGIVAELRRHNSQYILIRATDPVDQLFLARYLRTEYPQGRIVTIGADMLFRREAEDPRLHGVLALTTYSLIPSANHNFNSYQKDHVERVFPSANEAGTYNAMRSLLTAWVLDPVQTDGVCREEKQVDSRSCRHLIARHPQEGDAKSGPPPLSLYQYGWPYELEWKPGQEPPTVDQEAHRPALYHYAAPVRLLALGRDDYWPIASLGPFRGEPTSSTLPRVANQLVEKLGPVYIPNSWRIVQLVAIALGVGFALSLWFSSIFSRTQTLAKYAPAENDSRSALVVIAGLTLIFSMLTLLWPSIHGAQSQKPFVEWCVRFTIGLVFICTAIELGVRGALSHGKPVVGAFKNPPLTVFVILSVLFVVRVTAEIPETSSLILRFGTVRATQLASGLSFIVPLFFFLTVWLWWADHVLAGSTLLDNRRPRLPQGMQNHRVLGLSEQALKHLQRAYDLRWGRYLLYWVILVCFIGGSWALSDPRHPVLTLERPILEIFLTVFLTLAIAGIITATLKLWGIWLATRRLLVSLDSLPLRRGFQRIKGFSWDPIWRLGAGSLEEFERMFSREREAMDCAMKTVRIKDPTLDNLMQGMIETYGEAAGVEQGFTINWWRRRKLELRLIRQFGAYQEEVAQVAGAALDYLASSWSEEQEKIASSENEANGCPPEVRACERFVCLLYINFLLVVLVRIRTLTVAIGGMYVLTLIGISQYPFEPKASLQLMLVVVLGFVVYVVGSVFSQIYRDNTLSAITDTDPGELGFDFWLRMAGFVALPLLSLMASQFPSINRFLYSWLQPAVEALNR